MTLEGRGDGGAYGEVYEVEKLESDDKVRSACSF